MGGKKMVGTSQRGLTILYATEAAAHMIVNYKNHRLLGLLRFLYQHG